MNARRSVEIGVLLFAWVVTAVAARAADPPAAQKPSGGPATKPAATQPAKSGKVGSILYRAPAGWEVAEKGNIVILNPAGETPKTCSVILVSGEVIPDGDFIKWFGDKWTKLCQGVPVVQGGEVQVKQGAGGVDVLFQSGLLQDDKKNQTGLLLYAAKVGDGVEWAVFQTVGGVLFNKYNKPVSNMLGSLRFERKEERAAPAPPKKAPAKPSENAVGDIRERGTIRPAGEEN